MGDKCREIPRLAGCAWNDAVSGFVAMCRLELRLVQGRDWERSQGIKSGSAKALSQEL